MNLFQMRTLGAAVALSLTVGTVSASSLTFEFVESRFYDAAEGNLRRLDSGFNDWSKVKWGQDGLHLSKTSGYRYENRQSTITAEVGDIFGIGEFKHANRLINPGTAISGVNLAIRGLVTVDGGPTVERIFDFRLGHTETSDAGSCALGGAAGQGANVQGCADGITISQSATSETFQMAGQDYKLNILGFSAGYFKAKDGIFDPMFLSQEGKTNRRVLSASFSAVTPGQAIAAPAPVPVPASLALSASGLSLLAGLGAYRRRRQRS